MDNNPTSPQMQPQTQITPEPKMPHNMRMATMSLLIIALLIVLGLIGYLWWRNQQDAPPATVGMTAQVSITSSGFTPATIKIQKGQRINFSNSDKEQHQLKPADPADGPLDSGQPLDSGEAFSTPFDQTGTFTYFDPLNPDLKGTVIVE